MTDKNRFIYLLKGYLEHNSSAEELQEFAQLIEQMDDETLWKLTAENWADHQPLHRMAEQDARLLLADILEKDKRAAPQTDSANRSVPRRLPWNRLMRYAAVLIGLLLVAGSIWKSHLWQPAGSPAALVRSTADTVSSDIAPGTEGAVLTLADGKKVILDSTIQDKQLLSGITDAIVKIKPGGIEYDAVVNRQSSGQKFNTLSTPASRTFHIKLPDGTEVWLNAASSIRYPIAFDRQKREVTITGEAYFEVAKRERPDGRGRVPFIVNIQTRNSGRSLSRVEVLGTHFNINAYGDDGNIRTTLLEGRVNVYAPDSRVATAILPGSQAVMGTVANSPVKVHPVDVQKAIAWKNGFFDFDKAGLKEVMQQIGRWYNVQVVYPEQIPDRVFWGKIQRSLYLSQVLSVLEQVNIHFKIDQNKIIVMP